MSIPSRLGSHRIHLTREKLSFGTTGGADVDAAEGMKETHH